MIFVGMVVSIPFFDSVPELRDFCTGARMSEGENQQMLTAPVMARILLSCVLALLVNVSNYMLLGKATVFVQQVTGMPCLFVVVLIYYATDYEACQNSFGSRVRLLLI